MDEQSFYEFGPFVLFPYDRLLLRDGKPVQLAPRVFDTLTALIENSGHLIAKSKLISILWPDTFVEEGTLARNISDLRKVLGEAPGSAKFIETVPKRGYRFSASVKLCHPSDNPVAISRQNNSGGSWDELSAGASPARSIAVLPFRPFRVEGRDEYLELGIADALITRLSNISQLVVRPTSSVRKYAGLGPDAAQAGRELRVDQVLEGGIQKVRDRIRVTAQLVSVEDGRSLWAGTYDERFTDIFSVEDAISEQVASALVLKLTGEEKRLIASHGTESSEAHRLYLMGRYYWNKRTREGYEKGIGYFAQAIDADGSYALAYAGLADCYSMLGRFGLIKPSDIMPKALSAAGVALELDNSLSESHASMALAAHIYSWDWAKAEHHYKLALQLNATLATPHHWYAVFLAETDHPQDALDEIEIAQALDPISLIIGADFGMILYLSRDYDGAIEQCRATLAMDPTYFRARMWLGCAYEQKGMYPEAIAEYQAARLLDDGPYVLEWLARAYALAGDKTASMSVLEELEELSSRVYVDSYYLASVHAASGQKLRALALLEQASRERSCWLTRLGVDPIFDSLRRAPRLARLMKNVGAAS